MQLPADARRLGTRAGARVAGARRAQGRALFVPMLVGTGVAQLSTLVDVQIASFIEDESVATLAYAQRLYLLPLSLFGVAIAQVALPTLAHDAARAGERVGAELGRVLAAHVVPHDPRRARLWRRSAGPR